MRRYFRNILKASGEVIGINQRNLELIYPNNPRKYFFLADDKSETKKLLEKYAIPAPRTYAIIDRAWETKMKLNELLHYESIVVKPSMGSGGNGILLLKKLEEGLWESPDGGTFTIDRLAMHIAAIVYGAYAHENMDKCIIEERVISHPFFDQIYKQGIPDLRIILSHHKPLMAMLRIPTARSGGKANLHQGAMGAGIDLTNGRILNGFYRNRITKMHPDSKLSFEGLLLPYWEEIISISIQISEVLPLKFIGIDIMIDKNKGPLVLEVNARPGLQIQNANMQGLGKVLREKYA